MKLTKIVDQSKDAVDGESISWSQVKNNHWQGMVLGVQNGCHSNMHINKVREIIGDFKNWNYYLITSD